MQSFFGSSNSETSSALALYQRLRATGATGPQLTTASRKLKRKRTFDDKPLKAVKQMEASRHAALDSIEQKKKKAKLEMAGLELTLAILDEEEKAIKKAKPTDILDQALACVAEAMAEDETGDDNTTVPMDLGSDEPEEVPDGKDASGSFEGADITKDPHFPRACEIATGQAEQIQVTEKDQDTACPVCLDKFMVSQYVLTGKFCDGGHPYHETCMVKQAIRGLRAIAIPSGEERDRKYPNWRNLDHCIVCKAQVFNLTAKPKPKPDEAKPDGPKPASSSSSSSSQT